MEVGSHTETPQMFDAIKLFVLRFAAFCSSEEGV